MKEYFQITFNLLTFFLFCFYTDLAAQESENFDDLIEKTQDGKVKIYLDGVFRISYKDCSKYYLIAEFDDRLFQFKDSLKVFYNNDNLFLTGSYQNGKLNGKFNSFYRNGKKKMEFEYASGNRTGIWENFSKNGKSIKKVIYKNNNEFLLEQRNELGEIIVENGNGKFIDSLYMSISGSQKSKLTGNVKSGLPDGEWNFYVSNTNYGKEYFENFTFKKGMSISPALGNELYYSHFNATFTGIIFLERLKIIGPSRCGQKTDIGVNDEFYEKIKKRFYKRKLNESISDNWFLVEIKTGTNKKITDVSIISKADDKSIGLLKELIFSLKKAITFPYKYKPGYDYFPIVIKNSKIFTPYDKEIELLSYKY